VPVDNQLYDRLADTWWEEDGWLNLLRTSLNPARFGYLRDAVAEHGLDPAACRALDVGCGGGLLAEEVAGLGFSVTGVDPSAASLETARAHARESSLEIDYVEGAGERLPFEDASFELVYCCDVLEHVEDLDAVLAESRRVLKPGGLYVFDTINRTPISKLVLIKLFQEWDSTRLVDPNLHDHAMFIKPRELQAAMARSGLELQHTTGFKPALNPISLVRLMRARRRGEISMPEFAAKARMKLSRDRSVSYIGRALPRP
jgi:2-polyprenyl-6-hydroxyphenyl methylase / 3-demethylubiquinone-9 3-methyltransferase